MSSEFMVQALPSMQSSTQGAIGNKSKVADAGKSATTQTSAPQVGNVLPSPRGNSSAAVQSEKADGNTAQTNPLTNEEVLEAVQNLNDFVQNTRRELNFSVDEDTGRTVVKVIDHETKDVIRQIPAEQVLELAKRVAETNEEKGNLFAVEV